VVPLAVGLCRVLRSAMTRPRLWKCKRVTSSTLFISNNVAGAHVTKLVPKLTPVEECVDVPKEVCQKTKGNPRTVLKPVTKK
jgi:hypothetical protein